MSNDQWDIVHWALIGFGVSLRFWISTLPTTMPRHKGEVK